MPLDEVGGRSPSTRLAVVTGADTVDHVLVRAADGATIAEADVLRTDDLTGTGNRTGTTADRQ